VTVYGINAVREALAAGRVERLLVGPRSDGRLQALLGEAAQRRVRVERVDAAALDRAARGGVHQGVVAVVGAREAWSPGELVTRAAGTPLIVVLDGVEDPQNVGAVLRTCDAAGVDGVVRQTRRAAPLDGAAAKASAGAVAHVRVADVVNISRALEELKAAGVWVVGLAGDAPRLYDQVDYTGPTAIVLGAEGTGLRRLVREGCDWVVRIPMAGRVESLNVSVAAGVVVFEAVRQRRTAAGRSGGDRGAAQEGG
jgi:23S rRNA (guanosine2251-2'-O)-methyltransferase